ncbi:hypothetical protein HI914_07243 [Erysiphe necator]|nr:hypothetical protein HI914_07243 [Erysiphe necator]
MDSIDNDVFVYGSGEVIEGRVEGIGGLGGEYEGDGTFDVWGDVEEIINGSDVLLFFISSLSVFFSLVKSEELQSWEAVILAVILRVILPLEPCITPGTAVEVAVDNFKSFDDLFLTTFIFVLLFSELLSFITLMVLVVFTEFSVFLGEAFKLFSLSEILV